MKVTKIASANTTAVTQRLWSYLKTTSAKTWCLLLFAFVTMGFQSPEWSYTKKVEYFASVDEINPYNLYEWMKFFEEDLRSEGIDISSWFPLQKEIRFVTTDDGWVGIANGMFDEDRIEVYINVEYWATLTQLERMYLIYHEFGHDYFEIWHHETEMMRTAMSLVRSELSWDKWLEWRAEFFQHIDEKNTQRLAGDTDSVSSDGSEVEECHFH